MEMVFHYAAEYVQVTAAYSNAVLVAILPHLSDFAKNLSLDVPLPLGVAHVERFTPEMRRGCIGGGVILTNGVLLGFQEGHAFLYESPHVFFGLQDPDEIPKFYGTLRMTKGDAVDLARRTIKQAGCSLEDVLADLEPQVELAEGIGTNVVPRYRITWLDPRGGTATEAEVNGDRKRVESLRFAGRETLRHPAPRVTVEPGDLPLGHPLRGMNEMGKDFNPEYAWKLVPIVMRSINDWARKLSLDFDLPITTNQVRRFYVSDQAGWPHAEITLTNNWQFTFRNSALTYVGSPRRFFESDPLPFRIKDYAGEWRLSEAEAVDLARREVAKLGYPQEFVHTNIKPRVFRPTDIRGCPPIPRLQIEWNYPDVEHKEQWIQVEVDCGRGTVEALLFDDSSFWKKRLPIEVPISLATKDDAGGRSPAKR
jgi:hypothetical protein